MQAANEGIQVERCGGSVRGRWRVSRCGGVAQFRYISSRCCRAVRRIVVAAGFVAQKAQPEKHRTNDADPG